MLKSEDVKVNYFNLWQNALRDLFPGIFLNFVVY